MAVGARDGRAALPGVDQVLRAAGAAALIERYGRTLVTDAVREALAERRRSAAAASVDAVLAASGAALARLMQPSQRRVFNLTGTVLHTNLGRAPLPEEAIAAAADAMRAPSTLEYDLASGRRGERDDHVAPWLVRLTGAEAALAVNNNAGALLLALNALAAGRQAIVSRGELIEIGGSFRLPDIMARAGTSLREVGTTNRTHLSDFEAAIGPDTGLILKVHTSNYEIRGFTAAVPAAQLAELAHWHSLPLVEDLGSGTLVDLDRWGLPHEPTVAEALKAGADLVTFSGDKLLGGPQAGLVVGRRDLVARLAKNPLKRALRLDKIRLAALEAMLRLYADPDRLAERLPALRLLARPHGEIAALAARLLPAISGALEGIAAAAVVDTKSQIGSGALPVSLLPSAGLALTPLAASGKAVEALARRLRGLPVPVIGRIEGGRVILDLRCLEDEEEFVTQLALLEVRGMILATAGHIDHGKTALVRALTGVDADRLPEEKRRGLTIDLGFAYTTLPDGTELGFVDVPGHERFLPNMLAGVLSIDRVLLIVAADDGPRPQTLEHLEILELIGIAEVTGIVTKIDRVPAERQSAVAAELAALLAEAGYAGSPIYKVSSVTGEGIDELRGHLRDGARAAAAARAASPAAGGFRLAIDRVFSLSGIGLVVTGTAAAGTVAVGDHLRLSPRSVEVRVRGVHAHNHPVERAQAGERVALNLAGSLPEGGEPGRGDWVVEPGLHRPVSRLDLALTVSRAAPAALRDGLPVHFHLGTEDLVGRLAVLGARTLAAGEAGFAQIDFERPIAALWGDRVIVRDHMARHTLAGGRVLDPGAPRRGRQRPERLAALGALAEPDAGTALQRLIDSAGIVALAPFAQARNMPLGEIVELVEAGGFHRVGAGDGTIAIGGERLRQLGDAIIGALAEWHRTQPDMLGPARGALFARLRGAAPEAALEAALAALLADGRVVRDAAALRLPEHQPRLGREDERLWQRVEPLLAADELRPPRVRELAAELGLEPEPLTRFLKRVERFGRVAAVAPNRFFLPETVVRLAEIAAALAAESPEQSFTASLFKDRSGIGRNLTIEVLEYLDRIGVTRRVGDARVVVRRAGELFG